MIAIQRSDQKLWPFRTVTLVWRDQTSTSPSMYSTSTLWRRLSGSSSKRLIAIQRSDQKLWPCRTVTLAWRARPDLLLTQYGFHIQSIVKGIRKLQQKFDRDPTVGSKAMALSNRYCSLARQDLHLTNYGFHIHFMDKGIRKLQ